MARITVAINVYNGMPFLPEALDSIRRQSIRDIAIVVVNDGSTDGSADYLASLADPRLTVINQPNRGPSHASNVAIAACKTEFLARMDADDVSLSGRLESQLAFMLDNPNVGLLGGQTAKLGSRSASRKVCMPCDHDAIWQTLNAGHHAMAHPTVMMRTEVIRRIGGYWDQRLADDDVDMMLRMGEVSRLANLEQVVLHYRLRQNSLCGADMHGIRFSCKYAIEVGRRRRMDLPEISPERFREQLSQRPWPERMADTLDVYARQQYRLAMEEVFGEQPLKGRARLLLAACCSPGLTLQRVTRTMRAAEFRLRLANLMRFRHSRPTTEAAFPAMAKPGQAPVVPD